jgi:AraC-like DNA-binding protein
MTGLEFWELGSNGVLLQIFAYLARIIQKTETESGAQTSEMISRIINSMQNDYRSEISVSEYAKKCNLSKSRFLHVFREQVGISPLQCVHRIRMEHAKFYLSQTSWSISQIASEVGFGDPLYFSRMFHKLEGCTPSEYRIQKRRKAVLTI